MAKSTVLDVIEGYYAALALDRLSRNGVLERLDGHATIADIAGQLDYDPEFLGALVEFVFQTTDVLDRAGGVYAIRDPYTRYYHLGFQLAKFIGSYGPAMAQLDDSLRSRGASEVYVDREIESRAYDLIDSPPNPIALSVVRERGIKSLIDFGCGTGTLLTALGTADHEFVGLGVDATLQMCCVARQRLMAAGLADRIKVVHGDARECDQLVGFTADAIHVKGLLNEFCSGDCIGVVTFLSKVRALFPGCLLIVVEYYGQLTRVSEIDSRYQHTLVHDMIQALTGQGVPPSDLASWARLYHAAGCCIERSYEGESQGINWFVHVVNLGPPPDAADSEMKIPGHSACGES